MTAKLLESVRETEAVMAADEEELVCRCLVSVNTTQNRATLDGSSADK